MVKAAAGHSPEEEEQQEHRSIKLMICNAKPSRDGHNSRAEIPLSLLSITIQWPGLRCSVCVKPEEAAFKTTSRLLPPVRIHVHPNSPYI